MTKFLSLDLNEIRNSFSKSEGIWENSTAQAINALPSGKQIFWGVPFDLGINKKSEPSLVVIGDNGSIDETIITLNRTVNYVVFAHLCDSRAKTTVAGQTSDYAGRGVPQVFWVVTAPGEHLADYIFNFEDGTSHTTHIRRRFEVNQVMTRMQSGFICRAHQELIPLDMRGPYPQNMWGRYQTEVSVGPPVSPPPEGPEPSWSLFALKNPSPEKTVSKLTLNPTGAATIGIGAITLFDGSENPLRHEKLETFEIRSMDQSLDSDKLSDVDVDTGIIARRYQVKSFEVDKWLKAPVKGRGDSCEESETHSLLDIAASKDAILTVTGKQIDISNAYRDKEISSHDKEITAKIINRKKTWVHGKIVDDETGKLIPARIHMRTPQGQYLPPYGHRREVNDNWFEDYGADVKLGDTQYAYVDGKFQGNLPVGDIYIEASQGFEYQPVRSKINVSPGQRELEIRLKRTEDRRKKGWVTADTHVHFISPETARLEAAAEGVNVINLLAAQWGDLFTNVGDITGSESGSSSGETIVWVGTENRQHFLGHISMLGVKGDPVFPMSTSGPTEGYFGDPTEKSMSEWADECRKKDGLVVVPHFPFPHSEIIAEVIQGKVDGLEFLDFWTPTMDTFSFHEYYRLLNCGYRAAVVGGTDKMSAGMPVGNVRTYANIGEADFSFESWSNAVRAGRTYTSSGPLLSFYVDGKQPGDELSMRGKGGSVQINAEAISLTGPIHKLDIVYNGQVLTSVENKKGATSLKIDDVIRVAGSGWLAARCVSEHKAWSVWPQHIAAHTSPVFVKVPGEDLFDNETAEYLITVMEGGMAWLDTLATRSNPKRDSAVKSIFEEALVSIRAKQHHHGH